MNNINVQEKVEKYQKDNKNPVTTTQLRLLLSNAVIIKNKIQVETRKGDEISDQCGKETKVKTFDNGFEISKKIKEIGKSAKKFNEFYRYLEEIVAYMKYYGFDK